MIICTCSPPRNEWLRSAESLLAEINTRCRTAAGAGGLFSDVAHPVLQNTKLNEAYRAGARTQASGTEAAIQTFEFVFFQKKSTTPKWIYNFFQTCFFFFFKKEE